MKTSSKIRTHKSHNLLFCDHKIPKTKFFCDHKKQTKTKRSENRVTNHKQKQSDFCLLAQHCLTVRIEKQYKQCIS